MLLTLFGVPGKLKKILDRLTVTRAANLDNVLSKLTWTNTKASYIDNTISSRASSTEALFISAQVAALPPGNVRSIQTGWLFNEALNLNTGTTVPYRYYVQIILAPLTDISKTRVIIEGSASGNNQAGMYSNLTLNQYIAFGYVHADGSLNLGVTVSGQYFSGKWTVVEYY